MNWSYKTVHFELKKEGILGSGFLDEAEVEQELNEFGRSGWELVSVLEVHDGVIAFFKQPYGGHQVERFVAPETESYTEPEPEYHRENVPDYEIAESPAENDRHTVTEEADMPHDQIDTDEEENNVDDGGIGAIKIE